MKRFTTDEIDSLLEQPAQSRATASLPEDYFKQMERRILSLTVEAETATSEAAPSATKPLPFAAPGAKTQRRRFALRPVWLGAAAAAVLLVCGLTVTLLHTEDTEPSAVVNKTTTDVGVNYDDCLADDDIYAHNQNTADDDLDDLDDLNEIYDADLFLDEM